MIDVLLICIRPVYGITWYLYVLAIYYLIFSSGKLNGTDPRIVLLILLVSSLLSSFTRINYFKISNVFYFALFFYIGILHNTKRGYVIGNRPVIIPMSIIALILIIICWDRTPFTGIDHAYRVEEIPVVKMLVGLGSSLLIWEIFESSKFRRSSFLILLGQSSLEIYVIHQVVITAMCVALKQVGASNVIVNMLITLIMCISLPLAFSKICKILNIYDIFFKPITYIMKRKD